MTFKILNLPEFIKALEKEVHATNGPKQRLAVGTEVREIHLERTRAGKDIHGGEFRPYSKKPTYISKRDRPAPRGGIKTPQTKNRVRAYNRKYDNPGAQSTRINRSTKPKGGKTMYFPGGYRQYKANLYGSRPNLTKTGRMLNSMAIKLQGKSIILYFHGAEANLKAYYSQKKRPFVGLLRQAEKDRVVGAWRRSLKK